MARTTTGPVAGLHMTTDFISIMHEEDLISTLRNLPWPERKGRLALHYGHTFSYKTMGIDASTPYIPFPDWLVAVLPPTDTRPDQVCVQYYAPGTGIPPHADTHSIYDALYALSLGHAVVMDFKRDEAWVEVDLPPRSMIQMTAEARLHYTHGIKKRKRDWIDGVERMRGDRWSITFRWLRHGDCECGNVKLCDTAQARQGTAKSFRWQEELQQES